MRIRTIKPEFWQNETIATLPEFTRLLAIALLNYADDHGYFMANHKLIAGNLFPFEDDSKKIPRSIQELSRVDYLELGIDSKGRQVARVVNFDKHQRVDKPKASIIKADFIVQDASKTHPRIVQDASQEEGKGKEGNREQGNGREHEGTDALPFDSSDFKFFWSNWEQHLSEKKKPLKPTTRKMQLAKLGEMGEVRAIAALKHSMTNGWQGIFEPDVRPNKINYKQSTNYAERHGNDNQEQYEIPDA
jgi:hypothetical protein